MPVELGLELVPTVGTDMWMKRLALLSSGSHELQKLGIDLYMVARHLLFVALGLGHPPLGVQRRVVEPVADEHASNPAQSDFDYVVSLQELSNPKRPQIVGLAEIENLLLNGGPRSEELGS